MTEPARDWRGTPITPGRTVVYGGPAGGSSIQQVEGTVEGFTKTGRVNVRVLRRSYSHGYREVVHVGPDSLTVVDSLPPTDKPTQAEVAAERNEQWRTYESHEFPPSFDPDNYPQPHPERGGPCRRCGTPQTEGREKECTSAVPE